MLFSSYSFLFVFLPATCVGFFVCGKAAGPRLAQFWLVAASFAFYGWWNPTMVPLLGASVLGNHAAIRLIDRCARNPRLQGAILLASIGANIALLAYFKYLAALLALLVPPGCPCLSVPALPLGISFFTFTQIGLLIDARAGVAVRSGLRDHALFVTFFPHLIAGPLLHHREMMPQFADAGTHRPCSANFAVGLTIFAIGLAKKTLLADALSGAANAAFADPSHLGALPAWQGALAYSFQLYFDFSGYSDMAIGLARIFGVRFPANFNSPYKAQSIIDYWQRWHMTLTRYLTLYLYTPLALRIARRRAALGLPVGRAMGTRGFLVGVAWPTLFTMTLAGIWHGAGLTFVVFGALHGVYLILNHAWRMFRPARWKPRQGRLRAAGRTAATFLCVLVGAVVFRAPTLRAAGDMLAGMAGLHGIGSFGARSGGAILREWLIIAALAPVIFAAPNTQEIMRAYAPVLGPVLGAMPSRFTAWKWQPRLEWAVACGALGALALLGIGGSVEFLYFAF